ncbi:phosphotransferase family protein [Streptomyces litchfieldiae]|uniref:Phosphotransferase n=1 Tax=Streptomyces litchfieldiae TaxID=3075543 RepID=A0ABU2MY51_9ACTN|nr:phosphotransferase [Streptomyces sp. DSM 44938]MDT0345474.1 phosphotransferase [Streptomyces sp. DSM 44938]
MRPLKHGYTNRTVGDGATVDKSYQGPDAARRLARERDLLTRLRDHLPVPPVLGADEHTLTLGFAPGVQGQELLDAGHAEAVLRACGEVLRRIHALPAEVPFAGPGDTGTVLVHGDFGPNNVLLDPGTFEVTAVVDWEFAHLGDPVEDLAWCEWIVRMYHPEHRESLRHFFAAYAGDVPPWPVRRTAMLARCASLQEFCHRWEPDGPGVRQWVERAGLTATWQE